ncbi:MAG: AraC family ligand binding domain-containing protein, partial [Gemmatimonadales bacterium]
MSALAIRPDDRRQLRVERFTPTLQSCESAAFGVGRFHLVFIEDGRGFCSIDARTHPARAGDLFLVAPGQRHDPVGLDETTNWVVSFGIDILGCGARLAEITSRIADGLFLTAFLNPEPPVPAQSFAVPLEERLRWLARLASLDRELRSRAVGSYSAAHAHLELLLIDVVRA